MHLAHIGGLALFALNSSLSHRISANPVNSIEIIGLLNFDNHRYSREKILTESRCLDIVIEFMYFGSIISLSGVTRSCV